MSSMDLKRSARIATAVATMLVGAACADDEAVASGKEPLMCIGGNSCSGMSECAGGPGGSDCAGMNECSGMGWSYVDSKEECDEAGGTIEDAG